MKSNAAGQLFGYSLQFPRALLRLLEAKPGSKIGVEVCGDVSVFFPGGCILSEEDKSSLNRDALTDTSINLWKTFHNWIQAIESGELNAQRDRFIIYTNHSVKTNSIIDRLNSVNSKDEIDDIIADAVQKMKDIASTQAVYKFKEYVLNVHVDVFKQIISHFELVSDNKADDVYDAIRIALRQKIIKDSQIEYLLENLTGWLQKLISTRIAAKAVAIITFEEYEQHFQTLFESIRTNQELIDYAISRMPSQAIKLATAKQEPIYVKQLEAIKSTQTEIIEAVADYFKADTNRQEWIERGLVDESSILDFEGRLTSFHQSAEQRIAILNSDKTEINRGKLLLLECHQRQEKIADKEPPDRTIQGSYHVLADEMSVGWHPNWKVLCPKTEDI